MLPPSLIIVYNVHLKLLNWETCDIEIETIDKTQSSQIPLEMLGRKSNMKHQLSPNCIGTTK